MKILVTGCVGFIGFHLSKRLLIDGYDLIGVDDINNYYGFIYRKLGQYGKSAQFYKKALQIDPRHKGALEYQGELFIKTNKKELAEKNLILLKNICGTSCPEYKKLEKALKKARNY